MNLCSLRDVYVFEVFEIESLGTLMLCDHPSAKNALITFGVVTSVPPPPSEALGYMGYLGYLVGGL